MRQQKRPLVRFTKQAVSGIVNHFFPVLSDLLYVKRRTVKKPFSMCRFFFLVSGFCHLYKREDFHCQGTGESICLLLGNGSGGEDPSFCSGVLSSAIKHSSRFCVFLSRPQSKLCSLEVVRPFSYITKTLLEKFFSALTGRQVCEKIEC